MAKKLADYVGERILIRSIPIKEKQAVVVKLVAIDEGGIWIEWQDATEQWLTKAKRTSLERTPVYFLPYARIEWILGVEDYPSFSDKSLE
jgi:hypothetical protein